VAGVVSGQPRFRHAHPLTAKAQGMMLDLRLGPCGDCENPAEWSDLDGVLARATAAAKDVEEDRDAAERAAEHYRGAIYDALSADGEGETRAILLRSLSLPGLGGEGMNPHQLISLLEDAIKRNPDRGNDKHAIGLTLVSGRSPGPAMGIRCERLGPVRGGTAWAIPARSLDKALENLRAALAVHAAEEER